MTPQKDNVLHFSLFAIVLVTVGCITGCADKERPIVREDVVLTESLDLFENPILPVAGQPAPNKAVATVNGKAIMSSQLQREANALALRLRTRMSPEQIEMQKEKIVQQALNQLINQQLLVSNAEKLDVQIPQDKIDLSIAEIVKSLPENSTLDNFLKQSGLTEENLRSNIELELSVQEMLRSQIEQPPPPTEEELQALYVENRDQFVMPERVRAFHIVVKNPNAQDPTAKEKAETIRTRILSGEDPEEIFNTYPAKEELEGGPVVFARGQIMPSLEAALFALQAGDTSAIETSPLGFHVFKVIERLDSQPIPLSEAKDQLSNRIQQQALQQKINQYLQELRSKAEIILEQPPNS